MSNRYYERDNTFLPWSGILRVVCETLLTHKLEDWQKGIISGCLKTGPKNKRITSRQASSLGGIWKYKIHDGEFVHHDWWPSENKEMKDEATTLSEIYSYAAQQ